MPGFLRKAKGFFQRKSYSLIWLTAILAGLVLIFFYFILLSSSLANIEGQVVAIHAEVAQNSKNKVEQFLDENIRSLNDLAQILSMVGGDKEKKVIIDRFLRERRTFAQIATLNNQGQEVLKNSRFAVFGDKDLKDLSASESFTASKQGEVYLSTVYASEKSEPFLTIGLAIKPSPDRISGVLLAELSLRTIWDIILEIKVGENGRAYLVDSQGYLIAHPDTQLVLKKTNLLERKIVKEIIIEKNSVQGLNKGEDYLNEKGEMVYALGLPLRTTGWGIFVEEPEKDAWASYRSVRRLGLISILAAIIFFGALSWGIRALAKALFELKKSQAALEDKTKALGKLNEELEARVRSRTEELEEAKAVLEIKVRARTRELQGLAQNLEAEVQKRTKEVYQRMEELERFQKLAVGRELKMIELKTKLSQLKET